MNWRTHRPAVLFSLRGLFHGATALLLLLCIFTLVIWTSQQWRRDSWIRRGLSGRFAYYEEIEISMFTNGIYLGRQLYYAHGAQPGVDPYVFWCRAPPMQPAAYAGALRPRASYDQRCKQRFAGQHSAA